MTPIPWLNKHSLAFPPLTKALRQPNGLIAAGGDLSPSRLLCAYRSGIFPWFEAGQPIFWWSPNPRCVMFPEKFKISRSLQKTLRRNAMCVQVDTNFTAVIDACSAPRAYTQKTWITTAMQSAYLKLHQLGYAHSVECYQSETLVGGLYGISLGKLFFGESMFHRVRDASKVALAFLVRFLYEQGCPLIDCQVENDHLMSLGGELLSRDDFGRYLTQYGTDKQAINWQQIAHKFPAWGKGQVC